MEFIKKRKYAFLAGLLALILIVGGVTGWMMLHSSESTINALFYGDAALIQKDDARKRQFVIGDTSLSSVELLAFSQSPSAKAAQKLVYLPLVMIDEDKNASYGLAETVSFDSSGSMAEVTIKDSASFSDGSPVTADDVIASYSTYLDKQRLIAGQTGAAGSIEGAEEYMSGSEETITGLEKVDDKTLRFTFVGVSPSNLDALSVPVLKTVQGEGYPAGAGAYAIKSVVNRQEIVLEKREGAASEYPYDEVVLKRVTTDSLETALQDGSIDLFFTSSEQTLQQAEECGYMTAYELPDTDYSFIGIRTDIEPLNNVEARRAVIQSVDRGKLADIAYESGTTPLCLFGSTRGGSNYSSILPYDPQAAKNALSDAGIDSLKVTILSNDDSSSRGIAQDLASMLMQNNIGVEQVYYNPNSTATQPENYSLYVILAEDGSQNSAFQAFLSESDGASDEFRVKIADRLRNDPLGVYDTAETFFSEQAAILPLHTGTRYAVVAADCNAENMLRLAR